jgi:hypothetical protein
VAEMFTLGSWRWRRRLLAWEEEQVDECMPLILSVTLQVDIKDQLLWISVPTEGYTVRSVYTMLTTTDVLPGSAVSGIIWSKLIPLKLSIFA